MAPDNARRSHVLQTVTLTLARCREHPNGHPGCGYEIVAPLGTDGRLNAELWRRERNRCRVRRFWVGEPDRSGRLVRRAGGFGGATWLIDYDDRTTEDDEPGFRLGGHCLVAGDYVSIRDAEQDLLLTFKVAYVDNGRKDAA